MAEKNTYNWEYLPDGTTPNSPLIKKIKLPSGNEYWIADAQARNIIGTDYNNNSTINSRLGVLEQAVAGGVSFIIAWDGNSTPVPANIPAGVKVTYNGTTYTGTLAASSAVPGAFYLVHSDTQLDKDVYDEYVPVGDSTKTWEKIGDTQIDLSDVVTDVSLNEVPDVVLGETTTFTDPERTITVTGTQTDVVLGADTTFNVSGDVEFGEPPTIAVDPSGVTHNVIEPTITVTPSTTYVGALSNGTADGVTGYPNPSRTSFVTSVDVEQGSKMVTDTITGTNGTDTATLISNKTDSKLVTVSITPTNGTDTATLITDKVDSKLVTDTIVGTNGTDTATLVTNKTTGKLATTTVIPAVSTSKNFVLSSTQQTTADGTVTASSTNTDILMGASVTNEVLSLGACTLDTQTTNSANTPTSVTYATAGTSTTVATGAITTGTDLITGFSTATKTLAKVADTAKTFATGALSSTGSGATLVQSFGTSDKTLAKVGTATTVATGALSSNGSGATLVQSFSTATKTLAKAATTAKTFATGALSTTGSGASVVTGVSVTGSASAITGLGTPSTSAFLTGVKLSSYTASAAGRVQVATGISSAFASGTAVSHDISTRENVLTGMPTATFSSAVSVGTNDRPTVITSMGTFKDGSHAITVGTNDRVNALTRATTITVTKGGSSSSTYNITVEGGAGDVVAYPESAASGDTVAIHNHGAFTTYSISTSPNVGSGTIGPDEEISITMPSENLVVYAIEI